MAQGIARVAVRNRSIARRATPARRSIQAAVAAALRKGPMSPTLVSSQTDFLRRLTPDGVIPVDADDGHWSAYTHLSPDGGNQLWVRRVAPQATFANIVIGQAHDGTSLLGKTATAWGTTSVGAGADSEDIDPEGTLPATGAYIGEFADDSAASTAAGASSRTQVDGDTYLDTALNVVKRYDGTNWVILTGDSAINGSLAASISGVTSAVFLGFLAGDSGAATALGGRGVHAFSGVGSVSYLFADTGGSDALKRVTAYRTATSVSGSGLATGDDASSTGFKHLTSDGAAIDITRSGTEPFFDNTALTEGRVEEYGSFAAAVNGQASDLLKAPELTLIYASSPGAWGNDIRVTIHPHSTLDSRDDVTPGEVVELRVHENGVRILDETHIVSRTNGLKDGRGDSLFIEDVLRRDSEYIRAVDSGQSGGFLETVNDDGYFVRSDDDYTGGNPTASVSVRQGDLSQGSDGATPTPFDYAEAYGDFDNLNIFPDIRVIMDGGQADPIVAARIGAIAASRNSTQGIINLPFGAFAPGWRDDETDLDLARGYMAQAGVSKTKHLSAYGPRLVMADEFNQREITVPVDGVAAGVIARNARDGRPYVPPAGPEYAQLSGFLDVEQRLSDSELSYMVDTIRVNPIRYEVGFGLTIWDQLTLEAVPTAEGDMHVRLALMDIGPGLQRALRSFIFRGNNDTQRGLVTSLVTSYMNGVQILGGVDRFEVVCDDTNNTEVEEQQQRIVIWLFIWPRGIAKYIDLYPILTPRGVTFSSALELAQAA